MNLVRSIICLSVVVTLLSGCGAYPVRETPEQAVAVKTVVSTAKQMIGVPYRYGGLNPAKGLDCSGLVYLAYKRAGYAVPRTSGQQYRASRRIHHTKLKPGDLVFFRLDGNKISHVGIYIGEGEFIHSPRTGKHVETASLENRFWRSRYSAAGRFTEL